MQSASIGKIESYTNGGKRTKLVVKIYDAVPRNIWDQDVLEEDTTDEHDPASQTSKLRSL
jgi:hypothetical protein